VPAPAKTSINPMSKSPGSADVTAKTPPWGKRGFLMGERRVGAARFANRSTDADKGSTNNNSGLGPLLLLFRSADGPYSAASIAPDMAGTGEVEWVGCLTKTMCSQFEHSNARTSPKIHQSGRAPRIMTASHSVHC
jgi:hypothetical protein